MYCRHCDVDLTLTHNAKLREECCLDCEEELAAEDFYDPPIITAALVACFMLLALLLLGYAAGVRPIASDPEHSEYRSGVCTPSKTTTYAGWCEPT